MAELIVYHANGKITFDYHAFGPSTYQIVGKEILEHNLRLPTAEETVFLLHSAYCSMRNVRKFVNIRDLVHRHGLLVFNRNLWTQNGVYVVRDPGAKESSEKLDPNDLEKILIGATEYNGVRISKDKSVRFAPKETYIFGEQTPEQLSKNGFVIASYGKVGAERLGDVATKTEYTVVGGENVSKGQKTVLTTSSLIIEFRFDPLGVESDYFYINYGRSHCYSLGVLKRW